MAYRSDFTLPNELLEQIAANELDRKSDAESIPCS